MKISIDFAPKFYKNSVTELFATLNAIPYHIRDELPLEKLFNELEMKKQFRGKFVRFPLTSARLKTLVFHAETLTGTSYNCEPYQVHEAPENASEFYLALMDFEGKSLEVVKKMLQLNAAYFPTEFNAEVFDNFKKQFPNTRAHGFQILYPKGYTNYRNIVSVNGAEFWLATDRPLPDINYAGATLKDTETCFKSFADVLIEFL